MRPLAFLPLLAALAGCGGPPPAPPAGGGWDDWQGEGLLVLADGDMAATAYADGKLYPIGGAADALLRIDPATGAVTQRLAVPNTVMGWPGSMTVSPDGRTAYVVTSRDSPAPGTERYDSAYTGMPDADTLTVVGLTRGEVASSAVCTRPLSVDLAPSGAWLLVACGDDGGELAIVPLTDDGPGEPRVLDLDVPALARRDTDAGASFAVVHPGGAAAGVLLASQGVTLVRFELGADGVPVRAEAEEPVANPGRWLGPGRWTGSGRHLIVADLGWGPKPLDAALNGDGALVSYALDPDGEARGETSAARVSKSPESFALNPSGDLAAVVNMERTYLPGGVPTGLFRGRHASSVSLVAVDEAAGTLTTLGAPVRFRGVLPEDAAFDASGRQLAVVVYQDHDAPRSGGWVTRFRVEGAGADRRLVETGPLVALPRGAHDIGALD